MASNQSTPTKKRIVHHTRYDSLPSTLTVIKSEIEDDETKVSSPDMYVPSKLVVINESQHNGSKLQPRRRKNKHKKSASIEISGLAKRAVFNSTNSPSVDEDTKVNDRHHYTMSYNMLQNLKKYNPKEQQDLISIQKKLTKWIGSEEYLILSQFLDLMDKIAPHVSTQAATEMFDQMDPSNNGQIPTSLLLHDEFLPRMILVCYFYIIIHSIVCTFILI